MALARRLMTAGSSLSARIFRCIGARRWADQDPLLLMPPLGSMQQPGRWNDLDQITLYASHDPDTALAEKRRHLRTRETSAVASLARFAPGFKAPSEVAIIELDPPFVAATRTWDGRAAKHGSFARSLDPCGDARPLARSLLSQGFVRLIVPSSPQQSGWNSVFYYGGPGQLGYNDVPSALLATLVRRLWATSTAPRCP